MEKNYYLSVGSKLGGHYEIIQVLGEDDSEILYLVKDIHRRDTLFVLKEFYLKEHSFREAREVLPFEKSKYLFDERKKEILSEINLLLTHNHKDELQTYGYFEEHNTIYTIMEFINDANLTGYLKEETHDQTPEAPISELSVSEVPVENKSEKKQDKPKKEQKEEKKDSSIFLKILIVSVLIFLGLAYYAYDMIKTDKEKKHHNSVKVLVDKTPYHPELTSDATRAENNNTTNNMPNNFDANSSQEENLSEELVVTDLPITTFSTISIKRFLDQLITASINGSIDEVVSLYDENVDQYFNLKEVDHQTIYDDKVSYRNKWVNREFTIMDFKIIQAYKKGDVRYCDVKSTIHWEVSSANFIKTASGTSTNFLTLKKVGKGFKVKSIYSKK